MAIDDAYWETVRSCEADLIWTKVWLGIKFTIANSQATSL